VLRRLIPCSRAPRSENFPSCFCRKEGSERRNIHHKGLLYEGIEMHLHATYVSDYFKNEAAGHGDREADCSIINSEDNLEEYKETEE
jgi:hypothetical protein